MDPDIYLVDTYLSDLMVKDPDLLLCYFGSLDTGPVPVPHYLSKIERI